MKIVILDGYTENPGDLSWGGFEALGDVVLYDRTKGDEAEVLRRIGDAEIVITNKTQLTASIIEKMPRVRYIGVLATGYNVVDIAAAKEKGIPVTNIPTYGTTAVAQFAIAMLLELCHRIGHHDAAVHAGRWSESEDFCFWDFPLVELAGKTIGFIGFGRIGQATAMIAAALGMHVIATDAYESDAGRALASYVPLDALLAKADVISLHCPLTEETTGIINRDTIKKMKDGSMILNTARGPLIDEEALRDALNGGKLAGAALDVVSVEPIRADNPLLSAKNCVITPHIAWASKESRGRLMDIAVDNLRAFLGGEPQNVVNA